MPGSLPFAAWHRLFWRWIEGATVMPDASMFERQGTAMSTIGIKELQERAEDLVNRVEETGESIEIVVHGRVAARLVPSRWTDEVEPLSEAERAQTEEALARLKEIGEKLSKHWPEGVSAVDAIRDVRREH